MKPLLWNILWLVFGTAKDKIRHTSASSLNKTRRQRWTIMAFLNIAGLLLRHLMRRSLKKPKKS